MFRLRIARVMPLLRHQLEVLVEDFFRGVLLHGFLGGFGGVAGVVGWGRWGCG